MNNKYEKFLEDFKGKKYVSTTAEYRRTTRKTVRRTIRAEADVIFKEILNSVLRGTDIGKDKFFIEGEKISIKNNVAYIYKFKENKTFAFIYQNKSTSDYFIMTYEIDPTKRGYSFVEFTYETKIAKTIAGFNGQLGNIKFKRKAKEYGYAVLDAIKKKVENKS